MEEKRLKNNYNAIENAKIIEVDFVSAELNALWELPLDAALCSLKLTVLYALER